MRILITGAQGMLGHALQEVFNDQEVLAWDREQLDITNSRQVQSKLAEVKPDVIINAAAYTNVDGAETERELAFAINEQGIANLAQVAKDTSSLLVHYSTDYVFPGDAQTGYAEDAQPGPAVNVYGQSKLAGEIALQKINPRHYLIRTAWLYGPYGKNFVQTMLKLAETKKDVSVINDQHGSPTFTKDVAQATRQLLDQNYKLGIYHLVNSGQTTWADFATKIFEVSHQSVVVHPIATSEYVTPAQRPQFSYLQNTKGPKLRPWTEALVEYLAM